MFLAERITKENGRTGVQVASLEYGVRHMANGFRVAKHHRYVAVSRIAFVALVTPTALASCDRCSPALVAKNPPVSSSRSSSFQRERKKEGAIFSMEIDIVNICVVICKEIRLHCDSNRGEFKIVLEYFSMVTSDDLRDLSQEKVNSYRSIGECGGVKEGKSVNFCYYTFPMM